MRLSIQSNYFVFNRKKLSTEKFRIYVAVADQMQTRVN